MPTGPPESDQLSRRQYLIRSAIARGADVFMAIEAVDSTLLAHPDWDPEELKTWEEWESDD